MKKIIFIIVVVFAAVISSQIASAQDECMLNMSYYQEYYKQGSKESKIAAIPSWRRAYNICKPGTRQNLYIHGADLYRILISQNSSNKEYCNALIDTLITLHKLRAQYYPTYAVKAYAALSRDVNNYLKGNPEKTHEILSKIIDEQGNKTDPSAFVADMNATVALYKKGALSPEDVISVYDKAMSCFDEIQKTDTTQHVRNIRKTVEGAFINSKVASCENLVALFEPRLEESKDDVEMVKKIAKLLANSQDECTDNELFLKVVTRMHELEPSANSAYYLYRLNAGRNNMGEALKYISEAAADETLDAETKAQYSFEYAVCLKSENQYVKAVEAANKAISLDSSYAGKGYMLIGQCWMNLSCGGNEVESRSKFWVACDYFNKAKAADSSLAEDAGKLISVCSGYFPATAEAFMYDLQNGQSYTASCGGLRASTTVRTH